MHAHNQNDIDKIWNNKKMKQEHKIQNTTTTISGTSALYRDC